LRRLFLAVLGATALVPDLGQAQANVRETALARLERARALAADAELLKAVAAKNALRESKAEIGRKDRAWSEDPRYPLRKELAGSDCAERLRELTKDDPAIVEVILMDAQGANVCVSRETSDYWQGDEAKFEKTFGANQELFVDEPAFDASSGTYAIQFSVLVQDGKAKAGALTLTLRVRREDLDPGRKP
jgi:hypothetical protein